ncbi:hypothetical protein MLD38_005412 [Melastoma candidum]|uniref:Uncharacterized protein n=1 Tax=Melastoma candidum TaxID=119954 RepID=A0ACB9RT06_9MYRT|nr:hypothetical protein MLD38_005412 [Melastoma candidum]
MISSWRRTGMTARRTRVSSIKVDAAAEVSVPTHFRCPISLDLMKDPVTMSSGITYDRESIEAWMEAGNRTCPVSTAVLRSVDPVPNHAIRKMIQEWCVENRTFGVERIPTPRIPVSQLDAREMVARVASAVEGKDWGLCKEMAAEVRRVIKESERNRRCVRSSGAGAVLAKASEELSRTGGFEENSGALEEILSTITAILPLDCDAQSSLGSTDSLRALSWLMRNGNVSARRNSVLAIREVVLGNKQRVLALSATEGVASALLKLIKEPICPLSTKSSLVVIYYMVTLDHPLREKVVSEFSNAGLVCLLLEALVDADRSVCEKALGVLDGMCDVEDGWKSLISHPLASPLLVKKLLRVSDLATEFAVSALWKLGRVCDKNGWFLGELVELGAFQKLLVLLQVGCGDTTKEKATELLKSLNVRRETMSECIDGHDFKVLKRPR